MKKGYFISGISSCLVHGIVIFLMIINFHFVLLKNCGKFSPQNIQTYLYQPSFIKKTENNLQIYFPTIANKIDEKSPIRVIKMTSIVTKPNLKSFEKDLVQHDSGENTASQLLQILHNAIRANQQYPVSALLLKQQGTVRIAFQLFPDGHLDNLQIVNSSGVASLDQSAITAVTNINPVRIANLYLKNPKIFYISLIYR